VEHFVERIANDKKLFELDGFTQRIVNAFVEKRLLCIKLQYLSICTNTRLIVDYLLFVLRVLLATMLHESPFRVFDISRLEVEFTEPVQITAVSVQMRLFVRVEAHEIGKNCFLVEDHIFDLVVGVRVEHGRVLSEDNPLH
jgi:hypothetical protein